MSAEMQITAIKVLATCATSDLHLEAGQRYVVPDEVTTADAVSLVRMGRAEVAEMPAKAAKVKKAE